MPDAIRSTFAGPGVAGALQALSIGGPTSWLGDCTFARDLQVGAFRNDTDGFPSPPSIELHHVGFWRFRWAVVAGARTLTVYAKQGLNESPRPSIRLKANSDVGLLVDTDFTAAASSGWVPITASFVATGSGVIWVECRNNLSSHIDAPCLFGGPRFADWLQGVPVVDVSEGSGSVSASGTARIVSPKQPHERAPLH